MLGLLRISRVRSRGSNSRPSCQCVVSPGPVGQRSLVQRASSIALKALAGSSLPEQYRIEWQRYGATASRQIQITPSAARSQQWLSARTGAACSAGCMHLRAVQLLGLLTAACLSHLGTATSSTHGQTHVSLRLHTNSGLNLTALRQKAQTQAIQSRHDGEEQTGFPTIVISLPEAEERRAAMRQRLEAAGVSYTFVDAVHSRQQVAQEQMLGEWGGLPDDWRGATAQGPQPFNLAVPWKCHTTTAAQMACLLSHLFAIFSAWQAGLGEVLVLEDDMLVLRMPSRALLKAAPKGWGALQLYMLGRGADILYSSPPAPWVPWQPGLFNTGSYLINREGMRRVLEAYLPGVVQSGSLMAASELNVSSVHESQCVADWMVFHAARTFVSTDFWFVEEANTSSIEAGALGIHHHSKALVLSLLAKDGFRSNFTK